MSAGFSTPLVWQMPCQDIFYDVDADVDVDALKLNSTALSLPHQTFEDVPTTTNKQKPDKGTRTSQSKFMPTKLFLKIILTSFFGLPYCTMQIYD